jgi:amino acid transporter
VVLCKLQAAGPCPTVKSTNPLLLLLLLLLQVGVMGVARIVTSMGRTHLFFPLFGKVSDRFGTPIWATLFVTVAALPLCILTDLPALIDM